MNIIYRHLRENNCLEDYCIILANQNIQLLKKYFPDYMKYDFCEESDFLEFCIKDLPLNEDFKKSLPYCTDARHRRYKKVCGISNDFSCLKCWRMVLEDKRKCLDLQKGLPKFLRKRSKPNFLK